MIALYVIGGIVGYFVCGTFFVGIQIGLKEIKRTDDAFPYFIVFWPICLVVWLGYLLFTTVYRIAVWFASPWDAKPKASHPSPVIDLSSVPALPDPETMPEEFKGKKE